MLTSISADGLLAGAGTAKAGGGAGPGLEPQSSYGSYGGDGPGGYGAADALAALGRMQSGGSLAGDGHVLRSPGHGGQYLQQNSLQSAFGSAAAQQLHAIGSESPDFSMHTTEGHIYPVLTLRLHVISVA